MAKQKAYNENLKPIEKELKVGDVILDDDDGKEWIVDRIDEKLGYTTIKKLKGRKEIRIERVSGSGGWGKEKNAPLYWEEEEEPDSDGGVDADFEPLKFSEMFKDPNFKV